MGNTNRPLKGDEVGEEEMTKVIPLAFHDQHSEYVQLSLDKRMAKRVESFCKGICFSNRPVAVNERVYVKIAEVSTSWSGVIRLGFTSVDPSTIDPASLPRYACPDLTTRQGYWAKALPERFAEQGNVLFYYVSRGGEVRFGVNGQEKGIFFADVNTSGPLWALIDIYGNTTGMQFIDEDRYNAESSRSVKLTNGSTGDVHLSSLTPTSQQPSTLPVHQETMVTPTSSLPGRISQSVVVRQSGGGPATKSNFATINTKQPMQRTSISTSSLDMLVFHTVTGRNVVPSADRTTAMRRLEDYCNGYVMTSRPIKLGEKIIIRIVTIDPTFQGTLAFGLTSCDPACLGPKDFPDDSDLLLDRPEYWVVYKDVCAQPQVNDELSFQLMPDGEVKYSRNGQPVVSLMFVDMSLPLWGFFDIYGSVQKIKLLNAIGQRSPLSSRHEVGQQQAVSPPLRSVSATSLPVNLSTSQQHHIPRKSIAATDSNVSRSSVVSSSQSGISQSITPPPRPPPSTSKNSPVTSRRSSSSPVASGFVTPPILPPKHGRPTPPQSVHSSSPVSVSSSSTSAIPPVPSRPVDLLRQSVLVDNLPSPLIRLPPPLIPMPADASNSQLTSVPSSILPPRDLVQQPPALPARHPSSPPVLSSLSLQPTFPASDSLSTPSQSFSGLPLQSTSLPASMPDQSTSIPPSTPVPSSPTPLALSPEAVQNANNECVVCMEKPSDSVVYACGHLCMCWDCATNVKNHKRPLCPICQQEIRDIIKIFRS